MLMWPCVSIFSVALVITEAVVYEMRYDAYRNSMALGSMVVDPSCIIRLVF